MGNNDIAETIRINIKRLLDENKLKQRDLAAILGVQESTVGKWIIGKNTPKMGTIQQIADYFNIGKSEILENDSLMARDNIKDDNDKFHKYCRELEIACLQLNESGRKSLLDYANYLLSFAENKKGYADCNQQAG